MSFSFLDRAIAERAVESLGIFKNLQTPKIVMLIEQNQLRIGINHRLITS